MSSSKSGSSAVPIAGRPDGTSPSVTPPLHTAAFRGLGRSAILPRCCVPGSSRAVLGISRADHLAGRGHSRC